jgi:hypothetical protein
MKEFFRSCGTVGGTNSITHRMQDLTIKYAPSMPESHGFLLDRK